MELSDLIDRLERLEQAVFGGSTGLKHNELDIQAEAYGVFARVNELISPYVECYQEGDRLILQTISSMNNGKAGLTAQISWLSKLVIEEDDGEVAKLAGVLSSKQRVGILRRLTRNELSSGELAEQTGMAGGHLHHHLRDLMHLDLLEKSEDGRYRATEKGVNTYMAMASMHRGLSYNSRSGFKQRLDEALKGEESSEHE